MSLLNIILAAVLTVMLLHADPCKAGRVLHVGKELTGLQSLQRGPVTPPGGSGCTYIPGRGGTGCPVMEMHFAGDWFGRRTASVYRRLTAPFTAVDTSVHN